MSNLSIRTLVLDTISSEPYRKALIANLYFHQILSLADSPSVGLNDLLSTVASYFSINTRFAEREADTAARSISRSFFRVSYLTEVIFSDASGKSIKVPNPASRPADLAYFTFCSTVSAQTVDCRAPSKSITLESSLRLPQSFSSSTLVSTTTSITGNTPSLTPIPPQTVTNLDFMLGNLSDVILSGMDQTKLRNLLIIARDTIRGRRESNTNDR